jgi:hypothetical protein
VFGALDGLEHLRFDCFDEHPHYHYIKNHENVNLIIRIDENALGDPIQWTIKRLRQRLPEMLEYAGADAVANQVKAEMQPVHAGIDTISDMMAEMQTRARARRGANPSSHDG